MNEIEFPDSLRDRAMTYLGNLMNDEACSVIGLCLRFLEALQAGCLPSLSQSLSISIYPYIFPYLHIYFFLLSIFFDSLSLSLLFISLYIYHICIISRPFDFQLISTFLFSHLTHGHFKKLDDTVHVLWLKGFIGESVDMQSCQAGAIERCVTGLRGIGDAELDEIFRQAEGPHLARIFLLSSFNVYHAVLPSTEAHEGKEKTLEEVRTTVNAVRLAKMLVGKGVTRLTSKAYVILLLEEYANLKISEFQVDPLQFQDSIDAVLSAVMDSYEDVILPFVDDELSHIEPTAS